MENKEAKKTINLYMKLSATEALASSLVAVICVIFFIERGLDLFEVSILIFAGKVVTVIFEVPTGAIADIFGRKISCICAYFGIAIGFLVYATSNSLFAFIVAVTIEAVALTLLSGALEAWLVDDVEHHLCKDSSMSILSEEDKEKIFMPIFAKEDQIVLVAKAIGALIGAFLASNNSVFPWVIASLVIFLVGIAAIIFMKEEYFVKQNISFKTSAKSMRKTIETSVKCARTNKAVRFILLMGILSSFAIQAPVTQYQPLFSEFIPNKMWFGYLWVAMAIASFGGARLSLWFSSKLQNQRKALFLSQIMIGLGILMSGIFAIFPVVLVVLATFLFFRFANGIMSPIERSYLNKNILSRERATIVSFLSMTAAISSAIGLLLAGLLAEHFSISAAWIFSGGILIVSTILLMKNGNHKI